VKLDHQSTSSAETMGLVHSMDVPFVHRVDRSLLVPAPCGGLRRLGSAHDGGCGINVVSEMPFSMVV
jgi:hypothetical protein